MLKPWFGGLVLVLVGGLITYTIAGPCYVNANFGVARNCMWSAIAPTGPCPWGPSIFNVPPSCGCYTSNSLVPAGTIGNMASGQMSQGYATWTCKTQTCCKKTIIGLTPIWPPVANVACIPGAAIPVGTASAWSAIGGACPGGGSGGSGGPVAVEVTEGV